MSLEVLDIAGGGVVVVISLSRFVWCFPSFIMESPTEIQQSQQTRAVGYLGLRL